MDVMDAIKERYSVRSYKKKEIEEEKLNRVLEAGRLAPSAKNLQEWRFVVVRDKEKIKKLMVSAKNQSFVGEAPVVIACCAVTDYYIMSCGQFAYPIDLAIAVDHITLSAVEEGLGTCWVGAFYEKEVKKILNIPQGIRVVVMLTLGYPDDFLPKKRRKPLSEIVMYDEWKK